MRHNYSIRFSSFIPVCANGWSPVRRWIWSVTQSRTLRTPNTVNTRIQRENEDIYHNRLHAEYVRTGAV